MHANDLPICEGRDFEMARVKKKFPNVFFKVHALRDASTWSPNATFSPIFGQFGDPWHCRATRVGVKTFPNLFLTVPALHEASICSPNATSFPNFRLIIDPDFSYGFGFWERLAVPLFLRIHFSKMDFSNTRIERTSGRDRNMDELRSVFGSPLAMEA